MKYCDINKKFLEKLKVIKNLEVELKSKNSYISRLTRKNDKQKEEILQLNEKLNVFMIIFNIKKSEKNLNLRYENSNLLRKITELERENIARCNKYEKIITEYKIKMEYLININDGLISQVKELSSKNSREQENNCNLEDEIKKVQSAKYNLEDDLNIVKGKYEYDIKELRKLEDKNKEINHKVKQLLSYLRTYHLESKEYKNQNWNLIDKLTFFYDQTNYQIQNLNPNNQNLKMNMIGVNSNDPNQKMEIGSNNDGIRI